MYLKFKFKSIAGGFQIEIQKCSNIYRHFTMPTSIGTNIHHCGPGDWSVTRHETTFPHMTTSGEFSAVLMIVDSVHGQQCVK